MKEYSGLEHELERSKQELALKSDFNLYDAFKIFDQCDSGSVSLSDLKYGLSNIGVFASNEELGLFVDRYDTDRNGRLRFSELSSALLPLDEYYKEMVNRRRSNNVRTFYREDAFSYSTRVALKELLKTHFRVERQAQRLRETLRNDPYFDVYDAFKACDINEDGVVTQNEVRALMEQRGWHVSNSEVIALMNKMDKDRDGRIGYAEFAQEMKPRNLLY